MDGYRNESLEDYLEAILILSKRGAVKCIRIAEYMGFARPSASIAVKRLTEKGYIDRDREMGICLTPQGKELAEKVYERHTYFRELLVKAGVPEKVAEKEACSLEHVLCEDSYQKLKAYLNSAGETEER